MNYIGTQNFETKRCFLRRIKLSDYTMMYENWAKYDEVCRYYPFNPVDDIEIYRDKVKHWISNYESDSYFHWVIEWKDLCFLFVSSRKYVKGSKQQSKTKHCPVLVSEILVSCLVSADIAANLRSHHPGKINQIYKRNNNSISMQKVKIT